MNGLSTFHPQDTFPFLIPPPVAHLSEPTQCIVAARALPTTRDRLTKWTSSSASAATRRSALAGGDGSVNLRCTVRHGLRVVRCRIRLLARLPLRPASRNPPEMLLAVLRDRRPTAACTQLLCRFVHQTSCPLPGLRGAESSLMWPAFVGRVPGRKQRSSERWPSPAPVSRCGCNRPDHRPVRGFRPRTG